MLLSKSRPNSQSLYLQALALAGIMGFFMLNAQRQAPDFSILSAGASSQQSWLDPVESSYASLGIAAKPSSDDHLALSGDVERYSERQTRESFSSFSASFETWMLCRSDWAELYFNTESIAQGKAQIEYRELALLDNLRDELFGPEQLDEYSMGAERLRMSLSSGRLRLETTKSESERMYQGQLYVYDKSGQQNSSAVNCTPLSRRVL